MIAAIELADLLRTIAAATVAGVGVTGVYALALLGTSRTLDARRSGRGPGAWPALALLAGLGVAASVILGIYAVAAG